MGINYLAPGPYMSFATRNGTYTSDGNALISNVPAGIQTADLLEANCIPLPVNPFNNFRNVIDGGDFSVNPWQRANTALFSSGVLASAITGSAPTYGPDRFFAVGSGSSPSVLFTQLADTTVPGFNQSCQVTRSSANTNTSPIYFGQIVETLNALKFQGQTVTLSFWARAAANYSGGNLSVALVSGTGTNQSAANAIAASWTGQAYVPLTLASANGTAGSATGPALQPISTSMTRYSFTGTVPAAATQLGVLLYWTPTGTAGTTDGLIFNGVQLETGATPSPFEHLEPQVVLEDCQRYAWAQVEPATGVILASGGATQAANAQVFVMGTPVQLLKAPTVTVAAGSFKVCAGAAAAAATSFAAGSTHTPNQISVTSALTQTAGGSATLQGGGGTGYILTSADL